MIAAFRLIAMSRTEFSTGTKNFLSSTGIYFALMIGGFFTTPVLLEYLGPVVFGIYKSIQKMFGFGQVSEGRVSETLKLKLGENIDKENSTLKPLFSRAISVWLRYLPLALLVYGGIALSSPFWLKADLKNQSLSMT